MTVRRIVFWTLCVFKRVHFLLFFLLASFLSAQNIQIINEKNGEPVSFVTVSNADASKTALSDIDGVVSIEQFNADDTLRFFHASFESIEVSYNSIKDNQWVIEMSENFLDLDEIVVSANKWEQNKKEIPNKIVSISPKEIAFENPQTTADVLSASGQLFVQKSQLGGGSPMIRGFAANSVLIVVDGVRMNNAIYRSGNLQNVISLDPNSLKSTEVVFGPGSVIYGSDALGGVMNFSTKDPHLAVGSDRKAFSGNGMMRYATANSEKTAHVDFNLGFKKFGSFTSFTFSDFADLRTGHKRPAEYSDFGKRPEYVARINNQDSIVTNDNVNLQIGSGYNQFNLMQKFKYRAYTKGEAKDNQYIDLIYAFHYSTTSNIPRYDRLIQYRNGQLRYGDWYYGPQEWMMNSIALNSTISTKLYDRYKITVADQIVKESRNSRSIYDTDLSQRFERVNVFSINADFEKKTKRGNIWYYGGEGVHNDVRSTAQVLDIATGDVSPESTRYPDGGSLMSTASLYTTYKWNISEKVKLLGGVRYSYIHLKAVFEDTTFYSFPFSRVDQYTDAFNGSVGGVYLPGKDWKFNINFASGFRSPNIDDIGKVFDSEPGVVVVPNSDLQPELSYNSEIGISKVINDRFRIGLVGYYSLLVNAMVRRDFQFNGEDFIEYEDTLSRVQALVNTGQANIYGFDFLFEGKMRSDLTFKTTLTFTEGMDLTDNIPLRHVPPIFGETRLTYKRNKWQASFYTQYNAWKHIDDFSPSEQNKPETYTEDGSPAWYTLNFKASYNFTKSIILNVGLENLLDVHYRPYSSGISAPGRNLIVALRAGF